MHIKELNSSTTKKVAIIAADLHLLKKPGMWSGRAEIAGDDVYALSQVADIVKEYDADLYLLGDTLDSVTNLPRPIIVTQRILEPLLNAGHGIRYIQGQHEIVVQAHYENYPWLSICRGSEHIHDSTFDFMGHRAFALDYFPEAFAAMHLSRIPADTEVLFLHGTAEEVMGIGYHFSMSSIPEHVKMIFAGDYHEPVEHTTESGTRLMYTGSTWMRSASEPTDKYVIKVTTDTSGNFVTERIPLKTRTVLKYSELDAAQRAGSIPIDDTLPEPLQKPVIIVDMPLEPEEYTNLAQHYHAHTLGSVTASTPFEYINVGDEQSDEQILERYVDRDQYSSEFDFTLDLIQNPVGDALQRLKTKLGIDTEDVTVPPADTAESNGAEINLGGG